METARFNAALIMLDDARHLLGVDRWASAISRAYYCSYQAMWAALGAPPQAQQWRHAAVIPILSGDIGLPLPIHEQDQVYWNPYDGPFSGFIKSGLMSTMISSS